MSHGANQLTGRGRIILSVAVVALLAVVAAVATVVISSATYDPTPRTLSPKTQVAAGSDHVDAEAGVEVRVPEGWRVEPGDLVYGSTALVPDRSLGATSATGAAAGGLVYAAVVGEGEQRYWLTYVGTPGDGAMESPGREWADEIVERLHRTEGDDDVAAVENAPGQTA